MGLPVWHERKGDPGPPAPVRVSERGEVEIGQRVAVDQQERLGADDLQRLSRSAGGAEQDRLFPRVAHADGQVAAISHHGSDCLRQMMQVQHDVGDSAGGEPARFGAPGSAATGMAGLARTSVNGRRRVPRPAVRIIAVVNLGIISGCRIAGLQDCRKGRERKEIAPPLNPAFL